MIGVGVGFPVCVCPEANGTPVFRTDWNYCKNPDLNIELGDILTPNRSLLDMLI